MELAEIEKQFRDQFKIRGNKIRSRRERFLIKWIADLYVRLRLPESKRALLMLWEDRKIEIKDTGNCKNNHGTNFFAGNYTQDQMLDYCERMISKVLNKEA